MGLYVYEGNPRRWVFVVRGSENDTGYDYESSNTDYNLTFVPGVRNIEIEFELNYAAGNTNSFAECRIDGTSLGVRSGGTFGVKDSGSVDGSAFLSFGTYTDKHQVADVGEPIVPGEYPIVSIRSAELFTE